MVNQGTGHRPPTAGRSAGLLKRLPARAWLALVLMVGSLSLGALPASAELVPAAGSPNFVGPFTVGDQSRAVTLSVTNVSNNVGSPDSTIPVRLTEVGFTPSCANFSGVGLCTIPELGVFELATGPTAATGTGGACVGTTFSVMGPDATGRYTILPNTPVTLGPANGAGPLPPTCLLDLTLIEVDRVPTVDVAPGTPGVQTRRSVDAQITDPILVRSGSVFNTELITVLQAPALLSTVSTPNQTAGGGSPALPGTTATDTATVTRANPLADPAPSGSVVFRLVGPGPNATCTTPVVFTSGPVAVNPATGMATSPASPPLAAGTYNWVADYSGDANYLPVIGAGCNVASERFTIASLPTIIVTKAANPLTLDEPGGTFTFNVTVGNTSPRPVTITELTDDIYLNIATQGTCTTAIGTVLGADPDGAGPALGGVYSCSFPGLFEGNADDAQTDTVSATVVDDLGQAATDDAFATVTLTDVLPVIEVQKTATPVTLPEPGGTFTFTVVVTNASDEPVTIQTLTDDIYGNLATRAGSTCGTRIGTVLAPGASSPSCTFPGDFTGIPGAEQTDVVTATADDDEGNTATADDDATVTITNLVPDILVDKTATPTSLPAPGGTFTFTVRVTNVSIEPLTITALTDDIYGNLATKGTCTNAIGFVLTGSGGTYSCTFTGSFTGQAGDSQTDIVTAAAVDNEGTTATDADDATVTITGVAPTVVVDKTATPTSLPAPGGTFTFKVLVTNTSAESVTITMLTDDIYKNIATLGTCTTAIGKVLAPGATYTCEFPGTFMGVAGDKQTDVVTVTVRDGDGNEAKDQDDAIVTITTVPPPPPPEAIVNRPPGFLPRTGATVAKLVTLAGSLTLIGTLLFIASRQRPIGGGPFRSGERAARARRRR